jgi:exopolysaccharide biosynthesis polyprenyl glycosylphosphotransferase
MNNNNGSSEKYWLGVLRHFSIDAGVFGLAFVIGIFLRLEDRWAASLEQYWTGILIGAPFFACTIYIFGLYSPHSYNQNLFKRSLLLAAGVMAAVGLMTAIFYLNFSLRIGRGVMLISTGVAYLGVLLHHIYLLHQLRNYRERVALIVTSEEDEAEALLLREFGGHYLHLAGVIHYDGYRPTSSLRVLGKVSDLPSITVREKLERVLCTNQSILDPTMCRQFCQLRYSGVTVMPLIGLFEEMCQCVPIELITPEWLLSASGSPHMLYIKKVKRAFDIVASLTGLIFFWPFLFLGMFLVKLTSPTGSMFYRQVRCGRFGKPFQVLKLRTMRVDAEKGDTAVWASANDPRAIPCGNFLRKYRIDEIPQLWNVLRGEMSFVGPRPERPEFVASLSRQIPYFQERLLVQPGITGWAQVNYPYGASVEDAKHKLEYDFYYTKNMSVFLDIFILLDTVRIILRGGTKLPPRTKLPHYQSVPKPIAPLMGDDSATLTANG